jgi:hypothetical protein
LIFLRSSNSELYNFKAYFGEEKLPAVVSKRGVMMGTKKVGTLSSRRKRVKIIIAI